MRRTLSTLGLVVAFSATVAACKDNTGTNGVPTVPHGDITITANAATKTTTAFSPNTLTISLATSGKVVWSNGDVGDGVYVGGTQHHVVANDATFDLGLQDPGRTKSFTFTTAGTYNYHCSIHPGMVGTVIVTP